MAKQTVDGFLKAALPKGEGRHALMVGELHTQRGNHDYMRTHLDSLVNDYNVGTLAIEMQSMYQVFYWAYRDGKLQVPKDQAARYLKGIFECAADIDGTARGMSSSVKLNMEALDRNLDVIPFDTRQTSRDLPYMMLCVKIIAAYFKDHRQHLEDIRSDLGLMKKWPEQIPLPPHLIEAVQEGSFPQVLVDKLFADAFVLYEALVILKQNPQYRRWLDNYEAVVMAGRKMGIDSDALGAALIEAQARPNKNIIATAGLAHLLVPIADLGLGTDIAVQGTLSKQLARLGLPVTDCMIANNREAAIDLTDFLKKDGLIFEAKKNAGLPEYHVPPVLMADRNCVVDSQNPPWFPKFFSLDRTLANAKKAYAATPTPATQIDQVAHVERMHEKLQSPEMQAALDKLRPR